MSDEPSAMEQDLGLTREQFERKLGQATARANKLRAELDRLPLFQRYVKAERLANELSEYVFSRCESCDVLILCDDNFSSSEDGCYFCDPCMDEMMNEQAEPAPATEGEA